MHQDLQVLMKQEQTTADAEGNAECRKCIQQTSTRQSTARVKNIFGSNMSFNKYDDMQRMLKHMQKIVTGLLYWDQKIAPIVSHKYANK